MRSVVICGSRRFMPEMRTFANQLKEKGVLVYEPLSRSEEEWNSLSEESKRFVALGLTHEHFHKIRMADVVYIYNKGGYVGNGLTLEIGFAVGVGKPIYAHANDDEMCRQTLFRGIVSTPVDLIKHLQ